MNDIIKSVTSDLFVEIGKVIQHIDEQKSRIAELEAQLAAAPSGPAVEQQPFKAESIDGPEFRKLADAYHCVNEQDQVEPTYDAMVYFIDAEIERQVKAASAAPQSTDTDKVREAIKALHPEVDGVLFGAEKKGFELGFWRVRDAALTILDAMAVQAPVREVPEVNDAKYSEAEKAIGKIIFQRYPRIKGAHCASITIGILEYMGLRHSALNYNDREQQDE